MGMEHAPETVWQAQDLYCIDRLSFERVAEKIGVASSTLKRWSEIYGWRQKREEYAKAESDIRADKILARSKTIKTLLDNPRADTAFAVSALENLALKEAEIARVQAEREAAKAAAESSPPLSFADTAEAVAALRRAVEQKLTALLTRPEAVDLKAVQEVQKCLVLIADMEAARASADAALNTSGGLSANLAERILTAMSGGG